MAGRCRLERFRMAGRRPWRASGGLLLDPAAVWVPRRGSSGAADRLPVQLAQVVGGGLQVPLAAAGGQTAHAEAAGVLALLNLAEHRLHRGAAPTLAGEVPPAAML